MEKKFTTFSFRKRLTTMLNVDFNRMLRSYTFYIILACSLLIPVLMIVMMSMMDGSVSINQQTGLETVIHGPENVWQSIGTILHEDGSKMNGDEIFQMCNINMMFMLVSVFICLFISEDFRCGYAKNLFTVRGKKSDYVISKILAGFTCGALMIILYFVGTVIGGAIGNLSFKMIGFNGINLLMCILSKIFLMFVFVSIFVIISVAAKRKAWLSICGSLGGGMLLFMMVSMITPLQSTFINVVLCVAGGLMFSLGLGFGSVKVLEKTSLV